VLITLTCLIGYLIVIRKIATKAINDSINNTEGENASCSISEETPLIQHNGENSENQVVLSNDQRIVNTFKKIKIQALALFCTFVVTLSLFPSIISGIESVNIYI